jgi:hypothetical protein
MDQAPEDAPFLALYEEARAMYLDEVGRLAFKDSHDQVLPLAHGWFTRVRRTCDAVLLMQRSGLATESFPLRRAALEHTLALRWVAEVGNEVLDVVVRAHAHGSTKRQQAQAAAGWPSATQAVWNDIVEDAARATGNVGESHILTNLTARVEKYGSPNDLAAWLIETGRSHPGWFTAEPYWDKERGAELLVPVSNGSRLDASFCSSNLLRSLVAMNRMMENPVWDDRLRAMGERYRLLLERIA